MRLGIWIIGRRVNQRRLIWEFGQHAPHEQGPLSRVGLEIVRNDDRHPSACLRTSHRSPHLLTKDISGPACRNPAIKPPIAPVHQPKAIDLAVVARGFDQTLPAPPFQAPDTCERWVKGKLLNDIRNDEQRVLNLPLLVTFEALPHFPYSTIVSW